ncbi:hypothetical protein [Mesorhizobium sp. LNJC394B00]|uniref:hypothetical protein n=1 Tax=Mesorhizobium sp. LNJC394B00 TaxID=1287274 RepID=UPI0003CF18E3|nr:hypothetical protein [Mesorhizobium sp. LNJC394B00]ESY24368.1 hypothetical protein X750_10725 [Mesorhizobium sp. LNJC394B00]
MLRDAINRCRKDGTISVPTASVLAWSITSRLAAMNGGPAFRMGQTHTQRYLEPLLAMVQNGEIDPSF